MREMLQVRMRWWRTLFAGLLLALLPGAAIAQAAGQILVSVGDVRLIGADGNARPAERGAEVREGDQFLTGAGALAQIRMRDGTLLSVRAESDFKIERFTYAGADDTTASLLMQIVRGGLRSLTGAIGNANRAGYRITTPTATVGIRGTDHETVFVPPNLQQPPPVPPGTYDRVYSGQTVLQTAGQQLLINPNQVGFAPPAGAAPVILPTIPPIFSAAPAAPRTVVRDTQPPQGASDAAKADAPAGREPAPAAREGLPAGPRAAPGLITPLQSTPLDRPAAAGTPAPATSAPATLIAPTTISPARTISPATTIAPATVAPIAAPIIAPAATTIAPSAIIAPTAPAAIAPTVAPVIAPTVIQVAPVVQPVAPATPTLIQQPPAAISPTLTAPIVRP